MTAKKERFSQFQCDQWKSSRLNATAVWICLCLSHDEKMFIAINHSTKIYFVSFLLSIFIRLDFVAQYSYFSINEFFFSSFFFLLIKWRTKRRWKNKLAYEKKEEEYIDNTTKIKRSIEFTNDIENKILWIEIDANYGNDLQAKSLMICLLSDYLTLLTVLLSRFFPHLLIQCCTLNVVDLFNFKLDHGKFSC